jgi:hypothetical protein
VPSEDTQGDWCYFDGRCVVVDYAKEAHEDRPLEKYEVTMSIHASSVADTDPEVTKFVEADNERDALQKARVLIHADYPEFDYRRVWAWSIRRI